MNFERLLVTIRTPSGRERSEVWNTRRPLSIGHRSRFILERADQGVLVRRLPEVVGSVEDQASELIRDRDLAPGNRSPLPGNLGYSVEFKPLRGFRPAYHGSPQVLSQEQEQAVLAFSGVRRLVIHCRPIHAAFVAYAKGRPVLTVTKGPTGYRVKTLLPGVQVKVSGKSKLMAEVGQVFDFSFEEFFSATFVRGIYWWRFSQAIGISVSPERRNRPADREVRFFWKSLRWILGAVLLVSIAIRIFVPPVSFEDRVVRAPEVQVQAIQQKLKNYPRPTVVTDLSPEMEIKKDLTQKTESKAAPLAGPKLNEPKLTQENRASVAEAKKQAAKKRQMDAQAQALRSLMGDAQALVAKSIAVPTPTLSRSQESKSASSSELLQPAKPSALSMDSLPSQTKVEGVGGKGDPKSGSGYLGPVDAKVSGQGQSIVSIDPTSTYVEEGLSREEVGRVIQSHLSEVRYCYESALLFKPKIEGKVQVEFKIDGSGRVRVPNVQASTVDLPKLEGCIVDRLKTWNFPKPKGAVEVGVSYPFIFRTLSGAK